MKKTCNRCWEFFEEKNLKKCGKLLYCIACIRKDKEIKTIKELPEVEI